MIDVNVSRRPVAEAVGGYLGGLFEFFLDEHFEIHGRHHKSPHLLHEAGPGDTSGKRNVF